MKEKSKAPAFQFYVQDFIVGVRKFSAEQIGGYMMLLCEQWDQGALPDDLVFLKKIAGISKKSLQIVLTKFEKGEDGLLRNARMEKERKKQQAYKEQCKAGGLASAAKRGNKLLLRTNPNPTGALTQTLTGTLTDLRTGVENGLAENTNPSPTLLSSSSSSSSEYFKKEPVFEKSFDAHNDDDTTTNEHWITNPHWRDIGALPPDMTEANLRRLQATRRLLITEEQLDSCWESFKQLTLNGDKHYATPQHMYNHFGNWVKNENFSTILEQLPKYGGHFMKTKDPPADPRWRKMMEGS